MFILIVIAVILIIVIILYFKGNNQVTEEIIQCISDNSFVFVSKTCSHCAEQKRILGNYTGLFDLRDVEDHPEAFSQYNITGVPTWIIDNQKYPGVKTFQELKELTGC